MKKLLLLIFLLPLLSKAQSDSIKSLKDTLGLSTLQFDKSGLITYNTVEILPGLSKSEIYQRAKIWAALAFNSARNVTQFDDDSGTNIVIKALTQQYYIYKFLGTPYPVFYLMYFSLHFTFKDNKYRATFEKFSVEIPQSTEVIPQKYGLETLYRNLKEWNGNIKSGNSDFNRTMDITRRMARLEAEIINNLNSFAVTTLVDIKKGMLKSAKGDDF
ncbi:MAG: hypothetical protein JWP44_2637 [Mucilaginibacter sp.]|nr:hypothetical protein [Mucilaginibacter sp.]